MLGWLILWLAERTYTGLWLGMTAALARWRGIRLERVVYGAGPALGKGTWRLGSIPAGGWLSAEEGAPIPGELALVPHLVLGAGAVPFAGVARLEAVAAWVGGVFGVGDVRVGLLHGLSAAGRAAADAPLGTAAALWCWLAAWNALLAVSQVAARRGGERTMAVWAALWAAVSLLILGRMLWLDVFP
ncbi:MAG: hypothetical protein H6738_18995 [Alphaproteobacteria bacterium]|nr:hypothetical protein [Alphaproteobacteria bacterium]MCB9698876.1 hypothetical protein [Alphaproteobacteria bacterium]